MKTCRREEAPERPESLAGTPSSAGFGRRRGRTLMLAGLCVDLVVAALIAMLLAPAAAWAQAQMPDPSQMSGVPLPVADVAPGTVSVRVIRGAFTNNIAGASVVFTIDGQTRTVKTDANGRAEVSSLKPGTRVTAVVVVDGKRIESQPITIGASGIRVALVAPDPDAEKRAAEDAKLAAGPAVKGVVALGPESRIVVEPAEDALNVFYVLDILNTARTPVDIGGPFVVNLPAEALGPGLLDGSSPTGQGHRHARDGARALPAGHDRGAGWLRTAVQHEHRAPRAAVSGRVAERQFPPGAEGSHHFHVASTAHARREHAGRAARPGGARAGASRRAGIDNRLQRPAAPAAVAALHGAGAGGDNRGVRHVGGVSPARGGQPAGRPGLARRARPAAGGPGRARAAGTARAG